MKDFPTDISKENARKTLKLPQDKTLVVYTGYFYSWKGVDTLVKATALLSHDIEVVMVGGSEEDTKPLLKLKNDLNIQNIRFVGFRPYQEMSLYQKAADCLVVTASSKHAESYLFTSPLKLFEYMASQRPIVATRTPALEEILQNDRNACLVEPDDPKLLAVLSPEFIK